MPAGDAQVPAGQHAEVRPTVSAAIAVHFCVFAQELLADSFVETRAVGAMVALAVDLARSRRARGVRHRDDSHNDRGAGATRKNECLRPPLTPPRMAGPAANRRAFAVAAGLPAKLAPAHPRTSGRVQSPRDAAACSDEERAASQDANGVGTAAPDARRAARKWGCGLIAVDGWSIARAGADGESPRGRLSVREIP
jgi:hypothetical protein